MDKKIKELFAMVLQIPIDQINVTSTPLNTKKWDSLNHLNLIAVFEEKFSISIEPEEIPLMRESYGKFADIVLQKVGRLYDAG